MTITSNRGGKHTCSSCATRFYDLGKEPASCPKCKQLVPIVKPLVRRKRRMAGDSTAQERDSAQRVTVAPTKPKRARWKTGFSR